MDGEGSGSVRPELSDLEPDPDDAGRALLDLALGAAGIGTFDWDLATGSLSCDERLAELYGYGDGEVGSTSDAFTARLHPDDVGDVDDRVREAIAGGGSYAVEYRVLLPSGHTRWIAARGQALRNEQGTTVRVLGAAWDVTERRGAQERIGQIVDSMAVGFVTMNSDWVVTDVNAEAERITGVPREEIVGRELWAVFPATVGSEFEQGYRRAVATGQAAVLEAFYPGPVDRWIEVRAVPGPAGLSLYFLDVTARRRLEEEAAQAVRRQELLSGITEQLVGTLDADEAVSRLSRLVVPVVADWCVVTLIDDDRAAGSRRGLRNAASWHTDPGMRDAAAAYARTRLFALADEAIIGRALSSGQMQLVPRDATAAALALLAPGQVHDLMETLAPEAVAVLPLIGRTGPVGMLTLANGRARGPFRAEDLVTARHVAARAGLVLDNARLYRQQRSLAEGLQRSLLTPPPEPEEMQVAVRYVPAAQAAQVGGDWYDAFFQPDGATVLVIGDVVGHDTQAAAAMGQIRSIVRTLAARDGNGPAAVLGEVERVMCTLRANVLATSVVARLEQTGEDRARGVTRLRWSNAGHPPPMVLADGAVRVLTAQGSDLLLGVDPGAQRQESEVILPRDAVVLMYTDGLVERRDQDLDHGIARLQATLADLSGRPLDDLCDEVLARMLPPDPDDDVALVAVRLQSPAAEESLRRS